MPSRKWYSHEAHSLTSITGEQDPERAITVLAQQLIDEAGFEDPPFDPAILASFQNVLEVRRSSMSSAARLFPENGHLIIEVNRDHTPEKQNFSIDHEVTHTLFPTYSNTYIDDENTGAFSISLEEEYLCDIGAATLLLDPRALEPRARDYGPSLHALVELATLFRASLQATARQLAALDVWPCAFVCWEPGVRKAEEVSKGQGFLPGFDTFGKPKEKWRIKHAYPSSSFGHFLPPNKSVDASSLVAQAAEVPDNFTMGDEYIDLERRSVKLYCQNLFAPYKRGQEIQPRVISLVLADPSVATSANRPMVAPLLDLQ